MRKRRSLGLIGPTAAGRLLGCPRQSVYYLVKTKRLRPARRTPTGFWPDEVVRYGELLKTLPPERRGRPRGSRNLTEIERIVRGIFKDALGAETRDEAVAAMTAAREGADHMTTETLYRVKLKGLRLDEARQEREARQAKDERLKAKARAEADKEVAAQVKVAKAAAADAAELAVSAHAPYALVSCGDGHVVRVNLGNTETVARGTAVEALRRVCFAATEHHRERVARSRQAGAPQLAQDFVTPMLDASAGLLYGLRLGVVSVTDED